MTARAIIRLSASLALLAVAFWSVDLDHALARLAGLSPGWVVLAIALTVPQTVLAAWRWRVTSGALGEPLALVPATGEYYAATFLNQTLPGGVPGDALRAWRHGRKAAGGIGPAVRAVAIERFAGQITLLACLIAGIAIWPGAWSAAGPIVALAVAALGLAATIIWVATRSPGRIGRGAKALAIDSRRALLGPWQAQLVLSLLVTASYLAGFWAAGRAIGIDLPIWMTLTLVPAVLLSMLVPISVGGWGLREATAALLWPLAGLMAADGVAMAAVYGLSVLIGSLPGALVLLVYGRTPKVEVEQHVRPHGDMADRRS
jgi:uncharacterized membrane protein YbhN (UPF0104 family)